MKCPKCGYHSFEHLDNCKKCGQGLAEQRAKFNLRGFYSPGQQTPPPPPAHEPQIDTDAAEPSADGSVDFGFDFLEEDLGGDAPAAQSLDADSQEVSIDKPFDVDSETVPADDKGDDDPEDKPGKGPEFAF